MEKKEREHVFINSRGEEFPVEAVSVLLIKRIEGDLREQFEDQGKVLDPPQYCTELPNGAEQCFPHDKDTIDDPKTTDEERETWQEYQRNVMEFNSLLQDKYLGAIVMDQPEPKGDEWEVKLRWLDMKIPENPLDKKMLYYTSYVLITDQDIERFVTKVIEISMTGVDKETLQAARDTFLGKV